MRGVRPLPVAGALLLAGAALAGQLAQSQLDFSPVQGGGGWSYGILQGTDAGEEPTYDVAAFQQFDVFDADAGKWMPSAALVGAQNANFLSLKSDGGHPCGIGAGAADRIIWPTRRYVTSASPVSVRFHFASTNTVEPRGRGFTTHVFVAGTELQSAYVRDAFSPVSAAPIIVTSGAGTTIDFAVDPLGQPPYGTDSPYSDRADGFNFVAGIYDYPCQSDSDCGDVSCVANICCDPAVDFCPDAGIAGSPGFLVGCACSGGSGQAPLALVGAFIALVLWVERRVNLHHARQGGRDIV